MNWTIAKQQALKLLSQQIETHEIPAEQLAYLLGWLVKAKLGAATYEIIGQHSPQVKHVLAGVYYSDLYRETVQQKKLTEIIEQLNPSETEIVLLKGSAIAPIAWAPTYLRYKADVDFMVRRKQLQKVHDTLHELAYTYKKPDKIKPFFDDLPPTNKEGQIEMVSPTIDRVQVEAHTEIFLGHVQRLTNERIEEELWERKVPAENDQLPDGLWRLSNEDMVLHTMVHTAINHQFDRNTCRNMLDVLRLDQALDIDWDVVYERVVHMRVKTAVWLFMHCTASIFGQVPFDDVMPKLAPSWFRRRLLAKLITPAKVLDLHDIMKSKKRYALLLLLIDRPADMFKVLIRLPWLAAD